MDDWATPEVDALFALKLDQQLLNQVPFTGSEFNFFRQAPTGD